jgi:hypothetical protein
MVMQCFRSSRGYGNFFSIGKKPKGQLTGTALLSAGWKDRWPKHSALMEERRQKPSGQI